MRWLSEISVRRPVLASVLILGLAFLGLFSFYRLNIERWPNIDIPIVVVTGKPDAHEIFDDEIGRENVIMKPFEADGLLDVIRHHIGDPE